MVTECTVRYSNAQWSSHLKERLLAVLESHAPHWADTFVGVGFFFFSPITNIRFLKNGLWVSQWLFIPLDLKELSFVSVTGILSHLNRLRGKEHESRHKGWWQSVTHTHTHAILQELLLMEQNYLQREFTQDSNIKIHLYYVGGSDCRLHKRMTWVHLAWRGLFSECFRLAYGKHWYAFAYAVICFSRQLVSSETHINRKDTQHTHARMSTVSGVFKCQEALRVKK